MSTSIQKKSKIVFFCFRVAHTLTFVFKCDILTIYKKVKDDSVFKQAVNQLRERKYIIQLVAFLTLFLVIYTIVDYLNMSYSLMRTTYGMGLVVLNIILNIAMSSLSALLMTLSTIMVTLKGKEGKAQSFGFFSVLFGILTYGCTSCVIAFFASIGIAFSVIALPFAGLPYKLLSFVLIIIGIIYIRHELNQGACKINLDNS